MPWNMKKPKEYFIHTVPKYEGLLRRKCKKTSLKEVNNLNLIGIIEQLRFKGWVPGYGLAANQIGLLIQAAVFWYPITNTGVPHVLINPQILEYHEPTIIPGEGCLSIPNTRLIVNRFNRIKVLNNGKEYEVEGRLAEIIQHEVDHLNGMLIYDRKYDKYKVGRNDLCPCGSGKKYKKCCL